MLRNYLIKRIITTIVLFFIILNLQFLLFWVINPVDPAQVVIDPDFDPKTIELLRDIYAIDEPLHVQYITYIKNMLTLNFGVSFRSRQPVIEQVMEFLPNTLILVLTATIIQILLGVVIGLYTAGKRGRLIDFFLTGTGLVMYALPSFIVFLFFRYVFAEKLHFFPIVGTIITPPDNPFEYASQYMYRMTLPLITLILIGFGSWAFYTRNLSVDVLTQDFIQTAKAKGVGNSRLIFKHVLPAVLPPLITLVVLSLPRIIFGSIITEYVFTWKGIGWWYLRSLWSGDYPAAQALFFFYTVSLLIGNLLADILYGITDPRVRVGIRR